MDTCVQFCILLTVLSPKLASACLDGNCRNLTCPSFFFFANKRLVKHNITAVRVSDMDVCELRCYHDPNCVSVNFKSTSNSDGKYRCKLNNTTHRGRDDQFKDEEGYFYHGADSACDKAAHCENGGTCQAGFTDKGYRCICHLGFTGEICEKDINECATGTHNCSENAVCNNTRGGHNCTCKPGFTGDGRNCTDVNECDEGTHECSTDAVCNNVKGSFSCVCKPCFSGDGRTCTAVPLASQILSMDASYPGRLLQFLEPVVGTNSHWQLCYRATLHGWDVGKFHTNCDGKDDTVTIIKSGDYVFGGFTDIPWESIGGYGSTDKAFIFSLRNKEGLPPFKSTVTKDKSPYAIYRRSNYGPTFGTGYDIYVANYAHSNSQSFTNFGHGYSVPSEVKHKHNILAGSKNFSPTEVEVFYLDPSLPS